MPFADFSSVVPDAYVRATDDGLVYAMDLTAAVTQKNRDESSWALSHLDEKVFSQVIFKSRVPSVDFMA
jgi:hypothetical protein